MDEYGVVHDVKFLCCKCEPIAVTLSRAKLWPATPTNPKFSFTFDLLDWAESLLLECQVTLKDFCNSLYFRSPFQKSKKKEIYYSLIDSFEEYRFFKHNIRHMTYLCKDLDPGNVCPACPQTDGKTVFAIDALFGLPRKQSAGISYRGPLHNNLFFFDQVSLDEFILNSENPKSRLTDDCHNFLAGNMLRSSTRYRALDETAVFGACCRHEFPKYFMNLKHGERIAYSVWMLENMVLNKKDNSEIYVMYDIACILFKHLKLHNRTDILNIINLCLPTFHTYGHKVSCQILFGPRRCEGIGLSDGEAMERLWSFLRRFGRMTKEMRPSHRVDVLTDALIYYGIMRKQNLASLLLIRYERAAKIKLMAEESIDDLVTEFNGVVDDLSSNVKKWIKDEEISCQSVTHPAAKYPQWKIYYCKQLQEFYTLRNQLSNDAFGTNYISVSGVKRDIIDTFFILSRSKEELLMLKQECNNLIKFYQNQRDLVNKQMENRMAATDSYNRSAVSMLYKLDINLTALQNQGEQTRMKMNEIDENADYEIKEDSDLSDDENSDDDL